MSKKFKNNVGTNMKPLIRGKEEYKAPSEPPNLAAKFMRENRGGIPDEETPAMTLSGEAVNATAPADPAVPAVADAKPTVEASTPPATEAVAAVETPPTDAPPATEAAVEAPAARVGEAVGTSGDVPPTATVEAAAKPAAAPTIDRYNPREMIALLDGEPEWSRDDIVRGLQERATKQQEIESLRPAKAERDQMLRTLGAPDVKAAMGFIDPFVRAIKENPDRAKLLDVVAAMDPATIAYIQASLEQWNQAPAEQRQQWGQVGPTQTQTPTDPRYDQLAANQQLLEESLLKSRAEREVGTILGEWPFLRNDRKAWEAVQAVATAMYNEDEAKGIPPLQRRGYMEAIASQRPFLENMKQAQARRVVAAATEVARPSTLGGPPATSAILPATSPQPPVAARPPQRKEYRGPIDGAAAAFLADQGYTH